MAWPGRTLLGLLWAFAVILFLPGQSPGVDGLSRATSAALSGGTLGLWVSGVLVAARTCHRLRHLGSAGPGRVSSAVCPRGLSVAGLNLLGCGSEVPVLEAPRWALFGPGEALAARGSFGRATELRHRSVPVGTLWRGPWVGGDAVGRLLHPVQRLCLLLLGQSRVAPTVPRACGESRAGGIGMPLEEEMLKSGV